MTISEPILLDTNILVYAADTASPFHRASRDLRDRGVNGEFLLCVTPQVLSEFFAVVTNPRRVQTPRSPDEAMAEVEKYYRADHLLKIFPKEDLIERMIALFKIHPVSRQQIFDLQLVATMLSNRVTHLCTHNTAHFVPYPEIQTLTPEDPPLQPR